MEQNPIKTVAIIGLGALGILYAEHVSQYMPRDAIRIIADNDRIHRYQKDGIFCNGNKCDFHYLTPEDTGNPADLILFTVKYQGLKDAIKAVKNQVGENTIILSALNGINSEELIDKACDKAKVLYCVAQGMDAVKKGNRLSFHNKGMLVFGEKELGVDTLQVEKVASFFDRVHLPYQVDHNMRHRLWGKFMLNVGVNQTVAVVEGTYGDIQREGAAREKMIAAMREVIQLSAYEGITLKEEDLDYWLSVLGTLNPEGKPSMRQDLEAQRYSEVELFAGTVLELGKKYQLDTPVNQELYNTIKGIESMYTKS